MIEIIDLVSKPCAKPSKISDHFPRPDYPELEPEDLLFAYCSGEGSQGEKSNYVVTCRGEVYRVGLFEFGCKRFMERVCPFLRDWDYTAMPDLESLLRSDNRFAFRRYDWCWLGMLGAHTLYIHSSLAREFADATKDFDSAEMSRRWLEVAVGLVEKMRCVK